MSGCLGNKYSTAGRGSGSPPPLTASRVWRDPIKTRVLAGVTSKPPSPTSSPDRTILEDPYGAACGRHRPVDGVRIGLRGCMDAGGLSIRAVAGLSRRADKSSGGGMGIEGREGRSRNPYPSALPKPQAYLSLILLQNVRKERGFYPRYPRWPTTASAPGGAAAPASCCGDAAGWCR